MAGVGILSWYIYSLVRVENQELMVRAGDELYNYLLKEGALPVDKVQKIFAQLVGAVSYVHNLSCVHRDLKLENILLDKNENVKLCDFGFTREYEGKSSYLQTFCGTVAYSAPEMLKGEKYAGEKVDIWSLGVILYAVLCGELPFDEDDEQLMRAKILKDDPKYPDHLPQEARALIGKLLSKRPLLRPTLSDILADPFLAEHAPQQQAILKLQQPSQFSTALEKEVLERMRSAGVEIDHVIENVLAKRCDPLSGWWTLLLEKEERKHRRREQKRKEKEAEIRANRRLSAASSRRAPTLRDVNEEDGDSTLRPDPPKGRGRKERRSAHYPELVLTDLPGLPENSLLSSPLGGNPPPPIEKDNVRSVSSSRHRRPIPPPKEGTIRGARSRGSTLQLVTSSSPDLLHPNTAVRPPRRRHQYPFMAQLTHWKQWLITSTKRGRSPNTKASTSTPNLLPKSSMSPNVGPKTPNSRPNPPHSATLGPPITNGKQGYPAPPRIYTGSSSNKRHSLSPSPLTPRSTFRRGSSGLRGRKSTSSSVSSIRSIHRHRHSHSKASSTSSNGSDAVSKTPIGARSPHHSVKVLPATPTATSFPTNVRLVRNPPMSSFNESAQWGREGMGGLVFAKRKRSVFKGPTLNVQPGAAGEKPHGHGHSRSTSAVGRRSGEQTTIEEEEEEVEEVDAFGPLTGEGVYVEVVFEEPREEEKVKGGEKEKENEKGAE